MTFNGCPPPPPGGHPAYAFVEKWFHDCVYTMPQLLGFVLGTVSIMFWLVAQVPQFIANIRNQSAEALSAWFIAQWLIGDACNLIGCLLTGDQLPSEVYTAMYFVGSDVVLVYQIVYYGALKARREKLEEAQAEKQRRARERQRRRAKELRSRLAAGSAGRPVMQSSAIRISGRPAASSGPPNVAGSAPEHMLEGGRRPARDQLLNPTLFVSGMMLVALATSCAWAATARSELLEPGMPGLTSRKLQWSPDLWVEHHSHHEQASSRHRPAAVLPHLAAAGSHSRAPGGANERPLPPAPLAKQLGMVIGYVSSVFYLTSRLSQIYKNHKRGTVEGLSLAMFACAFSANTTYGLAILLRLDSRADLLRHAPWLIGSLGTLLLDAYIYASSYFLHPEPEPPAAAASASASGGEPVTQDSEGGEQSLAAPLLS